MYKTYFSNNVSELVKAYIPNLCLLLLQPQQLETYKGFYTNIIVTLWNQLPPTLRVDQSFGIFVNELEVFLFEEVQGHFDVQ